MSYLPNDHGLLSGLGADDHTQYHTDADGDALYPTKTGGGTSGTWPINITGSAASASSATNATSTGGAGTIQGRKFYWADVGVKTYLWGQNNNDGNARLSWEGNWARSNHNHSGSYRWLFGYKHVDVGSLAGGTGYGPWYWGHGLQGNTPVGVMATATYDDGTHSVVASVGNGPWDGTNVGICGRNLNASTAEACAMGFIAWV